MERHVLVVLPHPDDEAFGISGTLASYAASGVTVTYVCLTLGEMGRNMGNPIFANRETLPLIRKKELEESCRAIGIRDLRMLGLRDKTVEFEDWDILDAKIGAIIDEVNPSLIITFYPGYSVHPDHEATGASVVRCVARMPKERRPKVYAVAFANGTEEAIGAPDVMHDVSDYLSHKVGSISAHRSQVQFFLSRLTPSGVLEDEEMRARISKERFWTYRFD